MSPAMKIFKLALKQNPLSMGLVAAGQKPSSHCLVRVPKELAEEVNNRFKYHKVPGFKGVGFYVYPRWLSMQDKSDKFVQLMIFNDQALDEIVPLLNQHQASFVIENGEQARLTNIGFYKLARTKKKWTPTTKQDVTVICGISFGFPLQSTLKFGLETLMEKMVPTRRAYRVTKEVNLVFIGYPETKKESTSVIRNWTKFHKSKEFKVLLKQLRLITS